MPRLFALIAALLALSLLAPVVIAQEAPPGASPMASPAAGECVAPELPPGTPTAMEASPAAGMEDVEASPDAVETVEAGTPAVVASPELPAGDPAPEDVVAQVEAAVQNLADCLNAGEFLKYATLLTANALMEECGTTNPYDAPMCFHGIPPVTNVAVSDVQIHDDGRLSADVTYQLGPMLGHERMFFVPQLDESLLLDTSPDLPVEIPDSATVIEGEMADYEFILSQDSAPAGTVAFDVVNTGQYPHEIVVFQMPEGVTVEQAFEDPALQEQTQFFGYTFAEAGQEAPPLVLVDLQPGIYTLVCFVDVPEGIPHLMRGMVAEFTVTEAGT